MPHLLLYRFQFQRSYTLRQSILSLILLFLVLILRLYCSSFRGTSSLPCISWCNGSLCTFHSGSYMMIMDMLLLCWPQDDQAVVIMMIVSLIRLIVGSGDHFSSPFPPHTQLLLLLTLPMLLDCPTFAIHLLLFSVSLNDHFCVLLITWSFLVRHLTNGEVWKSFLLPKYVSCLLKAYQDVRKIYCWKENCWLRADIFMQCLICNYSEEVEQYWLEPK
jgi:hypothetical protein